VLAIEPAAEIHQAAAIGAKREARQVGKLLDLKRHSAGWALAPNHDAPEPLDEGFGVEELLELLLPDEGVEEVLVEEDADEDEEESALAAFW
jgi:hypothetical protein